MKDYFYLLGILGVIVASYGIFSAIVYSNATWFSYFAIGGTFFLGYVNYKIKNASIFEKSKTYLLKTYVVYLFFAILIEVLGRTILHFWDYPSFDLAHKIIHVFLIGYPFVFFFIHESFKIIRKKVSYFPFAFILATLINAFIHEAPNIFAQEWVYAIPYTNLKFLNIHIAVIAGWAILVAVPLITKRILK
ncbi:hypothetical protein HYX04_04375 [Candidatus Woesearchaeota archaeon]|nr:hypothetical protein [Candidatus Woesearchaeota archaeon]